MKRTPTTKRCTTCGLVKPLDEFYKKLSNPDGYADNCKLDHTPAPEVIGKRRYNTLYGRLIPLLGEMKDDQDPAAEKWFGRLMDILPDPVQEKVNAA